MALKILNFVVTVSLIFLVLALSLDCFIDVIKGIVEEYQNWRRFK